MTQIGHDSEWFHAKAFPALQSGKIRKKIKLEGVCGIYSTPEDAIEHLKERKGNKIAQATAKNYGARNIEAETKSIDDMIELIETGKLTYHHVNGDFSLPLKAHEGKNKVVYICSMNRTHYGYLKDAVSHGAHVILEKPAVVVMDEKGNADDFQLKELEEVVKSCPESQRMIDAEHYAHKEASTIFYSKLEDILGKEKIEKIECTLYEPDKTDKPRNVNLLNKKSRTGLLTDTGVHLLSFVSNLGGTATPIPETIKYGIHPKYEVETSVNAKYTIENNQGEYFAEGATVSLDLEKFSEERKNPTAQKTEKKVIFTLTDKSQVVIDLLTNTVIKINSNGKARNFKLGKKYDPNEYMNVMQDAYETITGKKAKARSDLRDSVRTMRAIYETYKIAPITDNTNIEARY